jgi:diguanylate cyclase (GGDEF)-like protein
LNRSRRYSSNFAILLLDVDHFKSVNDTYGHQIGDRVLVELARLLIEMTRNVDIVGRWGGEEFLVICPDTKIDGALDLAEKLRQAIAEHAFPVAGNLTASFGVTSFNTGDSIQLMMARADDALYLSKKMGRNRVETSA